MIIWKNFILTIIIFGSLIFGCEKDYSIIETAPEFITIAGYTYGEYDGDWFTVSNGNKADRVILTRLIVKPETDVDMYSFVFNAYGIPTLSIVSEFFDSFYVLKIPPENNPFEIARMLWDTKMFNYLVFDAAGERQ